MNQTGKKKVKAITRALQKSHRSPRTPSFRQPAPSSHPALTPSNTDKQLEAVDLNAPTTPHRTIPSSLSVTRSTPGGKKTERQPLRTPGSRFSGNVGSYGSILATPPQQAQGSDTASFELPDPALDPDEDYLPSEDGSGRNQELRTPSPVMARRATFGAPPTSAPTDASPNQLPSIARQPTAQSLREPNLTKSPSAKRTSQLLRRVFSGTEVETIDKARSGVDAALEVEKRQDEFFAFLDGELHKIDAFYLMKEQEATERLRVLRQQLHVMRDQRIHQFLESERNDGRGSSDSQHKPNGFGRLSGARLKDTLTGKPRFGKNSQALAEMATPGMSARDREFISNRRDFMRRQEPPNNDVSYRSAKRKLKHALQEFYRGIELLKGYAYLNRTAFRKINKKYDKAVNARPPLRYMSERVNKAAFVQSEVIESLMVSVEDLYARYFERGNRKIAASKLRHTIRKSGDYSPSTFRAGLFLMAGTLFAIQALVYAAQHLHHSDVRVHVWTSYLMQVRLPYFPRHV